MITKILIHRHVILCILFLLRIAQLLTTTQSFSFSNNSLQHVILRYNSLCNIPNDVPILVSKVTNKARVCLATSSESINKYQLEQKQEQSLLQWLTSHNGASCENIKISKNPQTELRGLYTTTENIKKNDVLLSVPVSACLQATDGINSVVGGEHQDELFPICFNNNNNNQQSFPKKVQLTLCLIQYWLLTNATEETQDSIQNIKQEKVYHNWLPYFQSWPTKLSGTPIDIPKKELQKEAQCEQLVEDTVAYYAWFKEEYQCVLEQINSSVDLSLPIFQRALQLVSSRSISFQKNSSILVPFLDMANHCPTPSAFYRLVENQIQLVATRSLAENEEITISYGDYTNRQLLGCYGFILPVNPFDYEVVSLIQILQAAKDAGYFQTLANDDDIFALEETVSSFGFSTNNFRFYYSHGLDDDLWLTLRAVVLVLEADDNNNDDDLVELVTILQAIDMDEAEEDDLWTNETNASKLARLSILYEACPILEQQIGGSSTTLEQDEMILKQNDNILSMERRHLVELRRNRKLLFRSLQLNLATQLKNI